MPRFSVILPAAGKSSRFGDPWRKKVFIDLLGRPVWLRTAEAFVHRKDVVQTILCISPDDQTWFREKFAANIAFLNIEVVGGGAERADTVQAGLAKVCAEAEYVAVHDAARPLIDKESIDAVFAAAERNGAALLATPISSTIKRVAHNEIVETVDRNNLWAAQTPQVFDRRLLAEAFAKRDGFLATDEAQLVERLGQPVAIVPGSPLNLKITTQDDLRMAAALLTLLPAGGGLGTIPASREKKSGLW
ncbi:MAG: 2-C-methyl-D-erythritol 4-phosphate cytidylyltransferase [Planctomycetaceae bacterium]